METLSSDWRRRDMKKGVFLTIALMTAISFLLYSPAQAQQAENWIAMPPYNLLWPLCSPGLSPPNPLTGVPTPMVSSLTNNTTLPKQPCLVWNLNLGRSWLVYNDPDDGLLYYDIHGVHYDFPPSELLDPITKLPVPITLPPGYQNLPAIPPDMSYDFILNYNISYSGFYGLPFSSLLAPEEVLCYYDCNIPMDSDGDGTPNCDDDCPGDPDKISPGSCGCSFADADGDGDGFLICNDCDDADPNINPEATELCDGKDNDCDDQIDEGLTRDTTCGVGACLGNTGIETCTAGVWGNDTCDPLQGATQEICDNLDNDCDGVVDDPDELVYLDYYRDTDVDGYGDPNNSEIACAQPDGFVLDSSDCDDANPNINPEATELCDGKDNDCDDQIDEGLTRDTTCGVGACSGNTGIETCTAGVWGDDTCDPLQGATQEICDNLDNDCDGVVDDPDELVYLDYYRDTDVDGYGDPNNSEIACAQPDGFVLDSSDCDDANPNINPEATELCDGKDNDCDDQIDEGLTRDTTCGVGVCSGNAGIETCTAGVWGNDTCDPLKGATVEICDNKDNDCDGTIDNGFADTDGDGIADCMDQCPNDPKDHCMEYIVNIAPDTMKIISFVHWPDDPNAFSVFGDDVRKDYIYKKLFKIGTYDPELGRYIEYGEDLIIKPGRGYWYYSKNGLNVVFNEVMLVTNPDMEVELFYDSNTKDGWNMIACPYNINYKWDDVQVLEYDQGGNLVYGPRDILGLVNEIDANDFNNPGPNNPHYIYRLLLWKWNNGTYVYYDPDPNSKYENDQYERDLDASMRPNEGYWVRVLKKNVFLRFPFSNNPKIKDSNPESLIRGIISQGEKSVSPSGKAFTASVDSPPAPLGGFGPDEDSFSETVSGGCFINIMHFGLPRHTR